jgi:hypothetical protein
MVLPFVMVSRGTESSAPVSCDWRWRARQHRHITHDAATWCGWRPRYFETSTQRQQRARNRVCLSRAAITIIDWADRLTDPRRCGQPERQMGACAQQTAAEGVSRRVLSCRTRHGRRQRTRRRPHALRTATAAARPRFAAALPRLSAPSPSRAVSGRAEGLLSIAHAANHGGAAPHLVCAGHAATGRPTCWRTNLAH